MKYLSNYGKKLSALLLVMIMVVSSVLAISAVNPANAIAAGQTKIAPTEAAPPHPFTIIDTPEGRLPADMGGGDYEVSVRQPDGTEFLVGMFKVLAPVVEPTVPTISPTSGPPGSPFTITDPQGRMQQGCFVLFYPEGTDPLLGNAASNVVVSADGKTLTGRVPGAAFVQTQHYATVRPALDMPALFGDLAFFVTA